MIVWGIVVAGGSGARFGRIKQFESLAGRTVLDWAVGALVPVCQGVVVVLPAELMARAELAPEVVVVTGGDSRSASVRAGLAALDDTVTHVLVHDAVRPLASPAVVGRVIGALAAGAAAAVPVVPVTDSLRSIEGRPVDRSQLVAVQTPQGFEVGVLRTAHQRAGTATDDASLVDDLGVAVVHVEGDPTNMKITEPHDLRIAEVLLDGR
jgi:2-C-methyl-D-erythritol 4-phosphate cytidylyltransferase